MENQSKKTIEEKRLEARRALEGEERGRRREEEEKRIAEEELREKEEVEKKIIEENERRKLNEKQKKDAVEKERKEKERRNREATEKEEEEQKEEERKNKQKEEEEKMNREALLMQMRPPGKKLRPLSKEIKTPKKNGAEVPHIKTYRNDATKAIKNQGESLTKIVLAEKKKAEEKTPPVETNKIQIASTPKKTTNKIIITGLIIMGVSSGALVYLYQNNKKEASSAIPKVTELEIPVVTITPATVRSLVVADTEKNIDISAGSATVLKTIAKELEETTGTDSIKNIYLTEKATVFTEKGASEIQQNLGITKLLSVWSNKMPALLSRSLSKEFMLGIYSSNPGRNMPFLILTTNSYEQTFAGMFKWENNILSDFYKLFGLSTKQTTQSFRDYVIRGSDVRILKNQTGETLMLYSFINKDMLIVTTNEEVLNKILFKLK